MTRLDVAAVIAIVGALSALGLPAIATTRSGDHGIQCLSNIERLGSAWILYASDNRDALPGNQFEGGQATSNQVWCAGVMDPQNPSQNTNASLILGAQLGKYTKTVSIYKCPADRTSWIRSVSMNGYMGTLDQPWTAGFRVFKKTSDFVFHSPAREFVVLDERSDSINDAMLVVDMTGYDPKAERGVTGPLNMIDFPGAYHEGSASFAFGDGHCEMHRWLDPRTYPPLVEGVPLYAHYGYNSHTYSVDVDWLQDHSSYWDHSPQR